MASTVSCALHPDSSSAMPRGPRRGSLLCCVSTAPIPAFANGQRLPTPMLDVEMPIPNIPVRAQRPAIENVIRMGSR
jgi:hypothetical protein